MPKYKVKTIDINALEWFDRVNGNSYFAAYVAVNFGMPTEQTLIIPYQYGYGEQYMHEAHQALQAAGFLPKTTSYKELTIICRDRGIILRHNKRENCKKRDLMAMSK